MKQRPFFHSEFSRTSTQVDLIRLTYSCLTNIHVWYAQLKYVHARNHFVVTVVTNGNIVFVIQSLPEVCIDRSIVKKSVKYSGIVWPIIDLEGSAKIKRRVTSHYCPNRELLQHKPSFIEVTTGVTNDWSLRQRPNKTSSYVTLKSQAAVITK